MTGGVNVYRITTNGHEYRIEQRFLSFWNQRESWVPVRMYHPLESPMIKFYATFDEAAEALREMEVRDARVLAEWIPVKAVNG